MLAVRRAGCAVGCDPPRAPVSSAPSSPARRPLLVSRAPFSPARRSLLRAALSGAPFSPARRSLRRALVSGASSSPARSANARPVLQCAQPRAEARARGLEGGGRIPRKKEACRMAQKECANYAKAVNRFDPHSNWRIEFLDYSEVVGLRFKGAQSIFRVRFRSRGPGTPREGGCTGQGPRSRKGAHRREERAGEGMAPETGAETRPPVSPASCAPSSPRLLRDVLSSSPARRPLLVSCAPSSPRLLRAALSGAPPPPARPHGS